MKTMCIYPQFLECAEYTLDKYWKEIFEQCANNKFPNGCKYNNIQNSIMVRVPEKGGKYTTEYYHLKNSPEENFETLIHVFKTKLNMRSGLDIRIQKEEIEEYLKEHEINLDCEWKKLKPKYLQQQIIINYILDLKEKYSLTKEEVKQLYQTIDGGFDFKKITAEDIDYSNGKIHSITCLEFNKKKRKFKITNDFAKSGRTEKSNTNNKFDMAIERFVKDYGKI